ncbi:lipid II:glycine glycyltransferase FemX [Mycobacterium sp. NPDC048908]|uniref:lipid II:glycine glycyltransferase FemX n=1 Tax=Mycobacterium sp. NPDC048908 TaxID=3364292 RepID=UPI003717422F
MIGRNLPDPLVDYETEDGRDTCSVRLSCRPDTRELAKWDELVQNVPGSDVAQLSPWAEVRRPAGFEPLYLFVQRGAELVGGALVLTRRLPLVGEVGYVPYGPVIAFGAERDPVIAALGAAMRRLASRKLRMLFVQPPLEGADISLELRRTGFRPSHAGIAPVASLRLDLAKDEGELFSALPKETRRRARKWPECGVRVHRGTEQDVPLLARLHAATARHHGFEPIPLNYLETLYRRLAPTGHVELFIGEVDGIPVFADLLTGCGGVLKGRVTGMDRDSAAGRLKVPAAVRWETIRWAKAKGYRWFDFGGIRDAAVTILQEERSDLSALTSSEVFKASFGGTPFRYPTPVEMISPAVVRAAYDFTLRGRASGRLAARTSHLLRLGGMSAGGVWRSVIPFAHRTNDAGSKTEDSPLGPIWNQEQSSQSS